VALVLAVGCSELEPLPPRQELQGEVGGAGSGGGPAASSVASTTSTGGAAGSDCSDAHEPNESEAEAAALGTLTGCGGGSSVDGMLDGAVDVDWFSYSGDDVAACIAPLRAITASAGLRLCKYAACRTGNTTVTCLDGSTAAMSPGGLDGCCHSQGFGMTVACTGGEDDATVYLSLDQAAAACVTYTLSFHY